MNPRDDKEGGTAIKPLPPVGAYLCDNVEKFAGYWVTEARKINVGHAEKQICMEQAINAWKNLAYDLARQAHYYLKTQAHYAESHVVPKEWVEFSLAAGETADGVMRRALASIATISPLSTAAPQEIARNALEAAGALSSAASTTPRSALADELDGKIECIDHVGTGDSVTGEKERQEWTDLAARIRSALSATPRSTDAERYRARRFMAYYLGLNCTGTTEEQFNRLYDEASDGLIASDQYQRANNSPDGGKQT